MTRTLSAEDVRRARVAAQLLHRPRTAGVAGVVARLLAIQAQDIHAAPLAIRARSRGLTAADVDRARADRSVARAWGPRGTLHLIAAEDLDWVVPLLVPPMVTHSLRRLRQEGVTGTEEKLVRAAAKALAGQGPLSKAELGERLRKGGIPARGQAIVHLAFLAAAHGLAVLGPDRRGKPTYVHAADWLGRPVGAAFDRDRALAELARRYLAAHAPAGPDDLATWSGLPLRDAKAAFAAVADSLTEVRWSDRPQPGTLAEPAHAILWRPRRGGPRPASVPAALLPAFDEYLLGWRDRTLIVDPGRWRLIAPGGGMISAAVLADGRIAGTWRTWGGGATASLFAPVDTAALATEAADVGRFLARGE
jgi:hypothetical protein